MLSHLVPWLERYVRIFRRYVQGLAAYKSSAMVIHARYVTNEEGNKLRNIVRHGKDPIELRRAQVILSSAQGFTPPKIGLIVMMNQKYVRTLIHLFNKEGFKMLKAALESWREYQIHRRAEARARLACYEQTKGPRTPISGAGA